MATAGIITAVKFPRNKKKTDVFKLFFSKNYDFSGLLVILLAIFVILQGQNDELK